MKQPSPATQDVLDFWFGDGLQLGWCSDPRDELWFGGSAAVDRQIREQFGTLVEQALEGGLGEWEATIESRLALVVLLDQFSRNIHRGQARAFAGDARSQRLVRQAIDSGADREIAPVGRVFLYMPLVHAEDLASQDDAVKQFEHLQNTSPPALYEKLGRNLHFARLHRDIVLQFGRFPHRNAALGRASTSQELEFLKEGPRFGQ